MPNKPTTYANPKTDIPRSAGKHRQLGRVQPGWWVHLEPYEDSPEGTPSGWEQVRMFMDWTDGTRTIAFEGEIEEGGGNALRAHKTIEAVTLTEREAAKLGLVAER